MGNDSEGFFANIYLKSIDRAIVSHEIAFGRYCDDMRIFGNDPDRVLKAFQWLQELLLIKGLNLNSAKTQWAQDSQEVEPPTATLYPHLEDRPRPAIEPTVNADIAQWIDRDFHEFDREFKPGQALTDEKDAKDYCKFIHQQAEEMTMEYRMEEVDTKASATEQWQSLQDQHDRWLENLDRTRGMPSRSPEQVDVLGDILRKWWGSAKHATWLLVQSSFFAQISPETQEASRQLLLDVLSDTHVHSYAKGRILRHLVKERNNWRGRKTPRSTIGSVEALKILLASMKESNDARPEVKDSAAETEEKQFDCFLFDLWDDMAEDQRNHLIKILANLLEVQAYDVTILVLYTFTVLFKRYTNLSHQEVIQYLQDSVNGSGPGVAPFQDCLYYYSRCPHRT